VQERLGILYIHIYSGLRPNSTVPKNGEQAWAVPLRAKKSFCR